MFLSVWSIGVYVPKMEVEIIRILNCTRMYCGLNVLFVWFWSIIEVFNFVLKYMVVNVYVYMRLKSVVLTLPQSLRCAENFVCSAALEFIRELETNETKINSRRGNDTKNTGLWNAPQWGERTSWKFRILCGLWVSKHTEFNTRSFRRGRVLISELVRVWVFCEYLPALSCKTDCLHGTMPPP